MLQIVHPSELFSSPAKAALSECSTSGYTSGGITITPSHGKVMYIDTGVSPKIDAAYIGYRITNNSSTDSISGYWVHLGDFRGGVISLANVRDADQQLVDSSNPLPEIAPLKSKTVYFLVKANSSTRVSQSHSVQVFPGRPDQSAISAVSECDFTFTKVAETIKAAANKVTAVNVITTGSLSAGQLVTVEVKGAAGIVGAGSPDVGRIMWFSPAAFSSFPTTALRLESVQIVTSPDNANFNNSADIRYYDERLLVTPSISPEQNNTSLLAYSGYTAGYKSLLTNADPLDSKRYYKNVYRFRVIGKSSSAATISPVSQISSGTQIKHTDLANSSSATLATQNVATPITVSKGLSTGSFYAGTGSYANYVRASYRVTIATTAPSGTEVAVEEVVDNPPSGAVFAGSASYRIGSGSTISITPVRLSSEANLSPQPYHFIGPFRITSTTSMVLDYQMYIPLSSGTYTNTAKGVIGDQTITTSTGYQLPGVSITTNGSSVTSTGSTTVTLNPEPVTLPASVSSGSTYLNGTVDANNQSSVVTFEYGTSSNLGTYTSVSAGSNTSSSSPVGYSYLFSGTAGTTYYFRIVATVGSTRYVGDILSFVTYEAVGTPTATTNIPLSVGSSTATIAGQVDPNLNTMSEIRFKLSTSSTSTSITSGSSSLSYSTLSSGSILIFKDTDETGAVVGNTTASGSSPTDFSWDLTGLASNTTYYYQIEAVYPAGTIVGEVRSFKTGTLGQTISFSAGSDVLISDSPKTVSGTASSGSAVTYTSEDSTVCTVNSATGLTTYEKVGTCTITVSQDGGETYSAASPVTDSFEISPSSPVATTGSATSIGQRSATLNGTVNVGGASTTDVTFLYSTVEAQVNSGSGGIRIDAALTPISSNGNSSIEISGINPATTYFYRIEATNATGTSAGSTLSFTTLGLTNRTLVLSIGSASLIYGGGNFNATSTPSAGETDGTKSWSSATTSVCTVVSSTGVVSIVSAGTCSLNSQITSGSTYASASATQLDVTISPKPVTITATDRSCNNCSTAPTFGFTHTSLVGSDEITGVTFNFSSGSVSSYNTPSTTPPTKDVGGTGTYLIIPSAATMSPGSTSNYSFSYVNGTYTVTALLDQTITFTTGSSQTYKTPFTVSATVSSGSAVTFSVSGSCTAAAPLTVDSGTGTVTITPTAVGSDNCTITASQPGGGTYGPASNVSQLISVTPAVLTVTADSKTRTYGDSAPTYTFAYSGFKSGDDSANSLSVAPTCTSDYTITTSVTQSPRTISCSGGTATNYSFDYVANSLVIQKANQTITFNTPINMIIGDARQALTYSSSSTLAVTVTPSNLSICTLTSGEVDAISAGTCVLVASQPGNDDYNAALDVTVDFLITAPSGSGGGGSGGGGTTIQAPPPPVITSLSRTQLCAATSEITIFGSNLDGATVKLDGIEVMVRSSSTNMVMVTLPAGSLGTKLISVSTKNGVSSASINYVTANKPKFQPIRIPYLSQGVAVNLDIIAEHASNFRLIGILPSGISFNNESGLISGTPTENGVFVLDVIAVGPCGDTTAVLELDVDAPTPNAISHRINFLPGSCTISESAKESFLRFIEKVKGVSPRNIIPDIYISGGYKESDPNGPLAQCRQEALCGVLLVEELLGEVLTDVFSGSEHRIEIIVYWERPSDDEI